MNSSFEGDLIRPLGLVTMNFGLAEYELDAFIESLASLRLVPESWSQRPLGQKLQLLTETIRGLDPSTHPMLDTLVAEARKLLERRNLLIHGCLLAGGRIVSGRAGVREKRTSVEDLNSLAQEVFNWKERLWSYRWKQVEPLLKALTANLPSDKDPKPTRKK